MASEEEGPQGHHPSPVRCSDHHGPCPSGRAGTREDSGPWREREQMKMGRDLYSLFEVSGSWIHHDWLTEDLQYLFLIPIENY